MLARPPPCIARTTLSGCVGSSIMSPTITVQVDAVGADTGELRLVELELHHLAVARARHGGVADAAAGLRRDLGRYRSAPGCRTPARSCRRAGTPRPASAAANGKVRRTLALAAHLDHDRRRADRTGAALASCVSRAGMVAGGVGSDGSAQRHAPGRDRARRRRRLGRRELGGLLRPRRAVGAAWRRGSAPRAAQPAVGGRRCGFLQRPERLVARSPAAHAARRALRRPRDSTGFSPLLGARPDRLRHRRRSCCPRGTCARRPCR